MSASFDIAVSILASRQDNLMSRAQVIELGASPKMIDRRLETGRWVRVGRGLYALPGVVLTPSVCLRAACLQLPAATVSHESAAEKHDVDAVVRGLSVVTVPRGTTNRTPFAQVHESTWLPGNHTQMIDGLLVTDRIRTLLDLSAVLRAGRYAHVLGQELASHAVSPDALVGAYECWTKRGRRRSAHFARIVGPFLEAAPKMNELEQALLRIVRAAGIEVPEAQVRLDWLPPEPGTVDFAYIARCLLVEVDGRTWHTRDAAYDRDRRRDAEATLRGWTVLRFTWRQVMFEPEYVVDVLQRVLARAA
jgi:very-short-patch-repair endonuclease